MSSVEALKARLLAHSMRAAPDCLDRITAEQWDVYQETAAVCKGAECANQAAAGNFGKCSACRQGWWPLSQPVRAWPSLCGGGGRRKLLPE
jgi:hypothetical protein